MRSSNSKGYFDETVGLTENKNVPWWVVQVEANQGFQEFKFVTWKFTLKMNATALLKLQING